VHHSEVGYICCGESHSECAVLTIATSAGSDPHRHLTEVAYDIGLSGSHSEYTVLTVTVSVGSESHGQVTEATYAT
jgi:hypothetical protein